MNYIHLHYDPGRNGEIVSWSQGPLHDYLESNASHLNGCLVTTINIPDGHIITVNPKTQRVDVDTMELVSKADDEIAHAMLPTLFEVKAAIVSDLQFTDQFANPPADMPLKGNLLLNWKPYRQALRDLSKLNGPVAMVKAWPPRPDGSDAIALLRSKIPD